MKNYLLILILFCFVAKSQNIIEYKGEKINALDEQGKPTGIWKVYVEGENLVIVTEYNSGEVIAGPNYYQNNILIASKNTEGIVVYEDNKKIQASYNSKYLGMPIDNDGKELDKSRYKYLVWPIQPMSYGGTEAIYNFIKSNINYQLFQGQKIKVTVRFVVDKLGKTSDITLIEGQNPKFDEEIIRVISILPRFQPAHQSGKFVRMAITLPITIN